jgi:hypothetical protein
MATTERITGGTADERAWDLFLQALEPDSPAAATVPPGAAVLAADAPDREELIRRYHADGRSVVLVDADGQTKTLKPRRIDLGWIAAVGVAVAAVWQWVRSSARIPV